MTADAASEKQLVLVVDDDEANRYATAWILREAGFEVIDAGTGKDGLYLALKRKPALVVLDVNLPDLSGFEVCERIKTQAETASIPVLHISAARVAAADRIQGLTHGADGYLTGTVDPLELIATVNALLRARRSEERAKELAAQWQRTFDSIGEAVVLVDTGGAVVRANRAFVELVGKPLEAVEGEPYRSLVVAAIGDDPAFWSRSEPAGAIERRIGARWWAASWDPVVGDDGRRLGTVQKLADVTAAKVAAEALRESEERLNLALSSAMMATLEWCVDSGELRWSDGAGRLFGVADRSAPTTYEELLDRVEREARSALEDGLAACRRGESLSSEVCVKWPDGSTHWLQIKGRAHAATDTRPARVLMALTEVTELRRAQENAERANRAKTQFLANMSHEIRTPLGVVLGYADLLLTTEQSEASRRDCAAAIRRNGEALLRLIDDILDLSKVEAGHLDAEILPVRLVDVLSDVEKAFAKTAASKGLALSFAVDPGTPKVVSTDPVRLRQILNNVVGNAVKFTEKGKVEVRVSTDGVMLVVDVVDTGCGVSPAQAARIFQPFRQADASTTRRFGGTGLGLALSRRIARRLGGDLELQSSGPSGSHFRITIKALSRTLDAAPAPAPGERAGAGAADDDHALRGVRVLVVDDAVENQIIARRFLEKAGAAVECAGNGFDAVDMALAGTHDAVIMDIQMPGLDGYGATRRLRQAGYARPIIALTAHAMIADEARCLEAGCSAYLTKPIDRRRLIQTVARLAKA